MSQPYVGQIIAVGFNYAPAGWALCQGQQLLDSIIAPLGSQVAARRQFGLDGNSRGGKPGPVACRTVVVNLEFRVAADISNAAMAQPHQIIGQFKKAVV